MNKVICDVCGTDYPETSAQCPICGCATAGGQTTVGSAEPACEGSVPYTYVKGGRFSKSNVRKRLKASQVQESRIVDPEPEDEDEEEDDEVEEETSNRGLVIIVVLLLLAIIAVSVYIAFSIFGIGSGDQSDNTGNPVIQTTPVAPSTTELPDRVACTSLVLRDMAINLQSEGSAWDLVVTVEPADTTDTVVFTSSDENVAVVDPATGRVTATGYGEAVITVTCGDVSVECPVSCLFTTEPTQNTEETEPTQQTESTEPTEDTQATEPEDTTTTEPSDEFVLKLRKDDFTLFNEGETYVLYNGDVAASEITWTSDNEEIATIKNGVVTAVGPGSTRVNGEYNGQKVVCWVRCNFKVEETTEPSENTEPTESTEATEPTESTEATSQGYVLRKNNAKCPYGDDYNAHATIKVGESFKLAVVDADGTVQNVTWSASKEGICTVSGTTVTGAASGNVTLTVTYGGQTFRCVLIVK